MSLNCKLANVKNARGHEGEPCPYGSLVLNGKKVGEFAFDTWGGPMSVHFTDPAAEQAIKTHCDLQPNIPCEWDTKGMKYSIESLIISLLEIVEHEKALKREFKKNILVEAAGKLTFWKIKHGGVDRYDAVKKAVLAKYPDAVILNELPFDEAFKKAVDAKVFAQD